MNNSTGYGPMKFLGYMRLQKLRDTILEADEDEIDDDKNAEALTELIRFLDDKSLSLVMRDAADDGRQALKILFFTLCKPKYSKSDFVVYGTYIISQMFRRDCD